MMHELNEERRRSAKKESTAKQAEKEVIDKLVDEQRKRLEAEKELAMLQEKAMESGSDEESEGERKAAALKIFLLEEKAKRDEMSHRCRMLALDHCHVFSHALQCDYLDPVGRVCPFPAP